jgi:uncharacterized membrane protein YbhN (UPF0104 family)
MNFRGRSIVAASLKVSVTVALCWLVLKNLDLHKALECVNGLSVAAWLVATAIFTVQIGVAVWRWVLVSRRTSAPLVFFPALQLFLLSLFYNQALPSTVPGDAARIWGAARFGGKGEAAVGVFLDRILTLLALLLLAGFSVIALLLSGRASPLLVVPLLVLAAAFCVLGILVILRHRLHGLLPARAGGFALRLGDALHRLAASADIAGLAAISIVIHLLGIAAIWVLAQGMNLPLTMTAALIAIPLVLLAALIPVSVNGWGVREGTMVAVLAGFGIAHTEAATLSVVYGLFQLVLGVLGGLFAMFAGRGGDAKALSSRA